MQSSNPHMNMLGNERLGMKDIVQRFGADKHLDTSVLDAESPLRVHPRDSNQQTLTANIRIVAGKKKGTGCVAAYELSVQ